MPRWRPSGAYEPYPRISGGFHRLDIGKYVMLGPIPKTREIDVPESLQYRSCTRAIKNKDYSDDVGSVYGHKWVSHETEYSGEGDIKRQINF